MKSDEFIREIEEELRQDDLKRLWDRYGLHAIGAVAVLVVGVAGFLGFQSWQQSAADAVATEYAAAERLLDPADEGQEGIAALEEFAAGAEPGFAAVARLRAAALSAASGDQTRAVNNLDQVVGSDGVDPLLRDIAILARASRDIDAGNGADVAADLAPLAAGDGVFRHSAIELIALAELQIGNRDGAIERLTALRDDALASGAQRGRAGELLAALGVDQS